MLATPEEVFTRSLTGFVLITIGFIVLFFGITLIMMEMATPTQPQINQTGTVIVIFPFLVIRTGYVSPLWIMIMMISLILLFFLIVYMITRYMFRGAHY